MYFPQSQIKTNLYTNGGEFVIKATNKNYIGSYWTTSSGKFYTKKNPQDTPYKELIESKTQSLPPLNTISVSILGLPNTGSIDNFNFDYNTVKSYDLARGIDIYQPQVKKLPTYYFPKPTKDDYNLGAFTRYLCKRTNQEIYIEISKDTYEGLVKANPEYLFSLYTPFKLNWTLTGESKEQVAKTNFEVTTLTEQRLKFRGLVKYFKFYSQFYQAR